MCCFESLKVNVLCNFSCFFFLLWQIKYKEKFDSEMKDKKHLYNPLESASFRQSQLATALASNVSCFLPHEWQFAEYYFQYVLILVLIDLAVW